MKQLFRNVSDSISDSFVRHLTHCVLTWCEERSNGQRDPLIYFYGDNVKSIVYKTTPFDLNDLKDRITLAIRSITPEMLNNVERNVYLRSKKKAQMINPQTALSTINEENESDLSTLTITQSENCDEMCEQLSTNSVENEFENNMSMQSKTFTIDSNDSSYKCFKEIVMSSSSIFQNPLYYFPALEDPGIQDALSKIAEEPFDDNGCQSYMNTCKKLAIYPITKVCKSLNEEELNLKYYVPFEKQMRAICKTLENNTYIQELNLQDNWLSVESCTYLATVLEKNTTLKILKMKECRIGTKGIATLSEALEMSSIQELDLSFNALGNEGVKEGKTAFSVNVNLTKLNLSHNELTEEAVIHLYDILVEAYFLVELDLSWNCFNSPKCMKKLCQGLVENPSLQRLNLAWNGISSDQSIFPFVRYLKKSVTLKFLDMSNNLIGGHAVDILMKGVAESRSLEHLKIGNNVFSPRKAYNCAEILSETREKPLKLIDMENMVVEKKFLDLLNLINQKGNKVIYGSVLKDYEIHGPYLPKVLFGRCKYLGMKPKKKKNRIDFGHFVLSLPQQPISPDEFQAALTARKLDNRLDSNLIAAILDHYKIDKSRKIDCSHLVSDYMVLYPETQPEPPKKMKPRNASSTKIIGRLSSLKRISSLNLKKDHQVSYGNAKEKQQGKKLRTSDFIVESEEAAKNALSASEVFFLESSKTENS